MRCMLCPVVLLILPVLGQWNDSVSDPGDGGDEFFHAADHHDFALLLSGTESQCYWHFARQSGRFYLTYMVSLNSVYHFASLLLWLGWFLFVCMSRLCILRKVSFWRQSKSFHFWRTEELHYVNCVVTLLLLISYCTIDLSDVFLTFYKIVSKVWTHFNDI